MSSRTGTGRSYLAARRKEASENRKSSIAESLGNFLDDCEGDDLVMNTVNKKKDHLSARSGHGSTGGGGGGSTRRSSLNREEPSISASEHSPRVRIRRSSSSPCNASGDTPPRRRSFEGRPPRKGSGDSTRKSPHARRGSQSEHVSQNSRSSPAHIDSVNEEGSESSAASFCEDEEEELQPPRPSRPSHGRKPPRAMSVTSGMEAKMNRMAVRDDRRAAIKDRYRVDDAASLASGRSASGGTVHSSASTVRRKIGSGLDGGPFNGFLNGSDDVPEKPARDISESFRERRSSSIEGILSEAKHEKWEREAQEHPEQEVRVNIDCDDMLGNGSDDDDQPRMKKKKEKGLRQVANLVITTAKLTRSTAKGSVNAVRDPKRAAKNLGHLTKDAAKGTVNVVRDPKKAAMNVTNLTTKTIKGTVKIGANVTKDVAKGGFKVTRTVAKGGLGATTMVVGRTTDGLGKVVHGATGLIIKREKGELGQGHAEYHAKDLPCRRKASMSLLDRVTEVVDTSDEALMAQAAAKKRSSNNPLMPASSLLVPPAAAPGRGSMGSWDVR
jgi:hypothetical protein